MSHFTIKELCYSSTAQARGIDNTPDAAVTKNLNLLIERVLEPLRIAYGKPIYVTSGYRSKRLNQAVKGASNSQHLTGQAADLVCDDNKRLFQLVQKINLPFDQLINEHPGQGGVPRWVHISYSPRNRRQILTIRK